VELGWIEVVEVFHDVYFLEGVLNRLDIYGFYAYGFLELGEICEQACHIDLVIDLHIFF
jgi:hypothetical protein